MLNFMKHLEGKRVLSGICFLFARDLHLQWILRSYCYYCITSHLNTRLQNVFFFKKKALKKLFFSEEICSTF